MKGYIYTMFKGADPGQGWRMTDPIFGKPPTLGACVPNIRRAVTQGDYVFAISGLTQGARQYVVGGFQVAEKIDALAAYQRFPANRQKLSPDGGVVGNIIVNADGSQSEIDYHGKFESHVHNYIVGKDPLVFTAPDEVARAREETLPTLSRIFGKQGRKVSDVLGRWRRLDEVQVLEMISWMKALKGV
jgi:hypothetical protein